MQFSASCFAKPTQAHSFKTNKCAPMSERGHQRGGRGGGRGDHRGGRGGHGGRGGGHDGGRGGHGGAAGERPKKENILDLGKYMDKKITVKFTGGREGSFLHQEESAGVGANRRK